MPSATESPNNNQEPHDHAEHEYGHRLVWRLGGVTIGSLVGIGIIASEETMNLLGTGGAFVGSVIGGLVLGDLGSRVARRFSGH